VDDLATQMMTYFTEENHRRDAALKCLNVIFEARSGIKIPPLSAAAFGSVRSAGHNIVVHGSGSIAVEFKNSMAGISALPAVELTGYVARLDSRMDGQLYERWKVPCLGLTIVGTLDIAAFNLYSDFLRL
jgi:hypothetical protein